MNILKKPIDVHKWLLWGVAIFFVLALIGGGLILAWEKYYEDKIFDGVRIGNIDLGGKTVSEAEAILNNRIEKIDDDGINFYFNDDSVNIRPTVSSLSGDFAYSVMEFQTQKSLEEVFKFGRDKDIFSNLNKRISGLFKSKQYTFLVNIKEEEIKNTLKDNFDKEKTPAQDASLEAERVAGEIEFNIVPEKYGENIDYKKGIKELEDNLKNLDLSTIHLESRKESPDIYKEECDGVPNMANDIIQKTPLTLLVPLEERTNISQEWTIEDSQLASWLQIKRRDEQVVVGLEHEKVKQFLEEIVAPQIDEEPREARLELDENKERVIEFEPSSDGVRLVIQENIEKIEEEIIFNESEKLEPVNLKIEKVECQIREDNIDDLGIKERIGVGHSDFSGSPANRVHNIEVGSEAVTGRLIEPGEEFSLVEALGTIDGESGYKPELVIKGNRTIPEYGGGLCQVSTTLFRAALESGLEITERRNHSYRVSYYEPAGMDAAIYPPHPDLRFINDTENHILIQYRIEGDQHYFEFWGTDDGREVEISDPVIYNQVQPGPTRLIESPDLEPGQRRCTERAHVGADAYFDYKVTYSDEEVKERRFHSHYVPWREVCLIGPKKETEEDLDELEEEEVEEILENTEEVEEDQVIDQEDTEDTEE